MESYLLDWANLLVRWLHLITGIAWIGASFYFVMLDNSLRPPSNPADARRGVFGELWAVHGGGFYCSQKFLTGPQGEPLSQDLHWSKWEAYTTWLSGMSLLAVVYWIGASSYLIDKQVLDIGQTAAIGLSVGFLAVGWVVYDVLCRNLMGRDGLLAVLVFIFVVAFFGSGFESTASNRSASSTKVSRSSRTASTCTFWWISSMVLAPSECQISLPWPLEGCTDWYTCDNHL